MSLFHATAGQAEIIRTIQKDVSYTNQVTSDIADVLQASGNRNWIKYNQYCRLLSELAYHGFCSLNSLQTLGEEYTGIIQVDKNYIAIPHKIVSFVL